MQTREGVTVLGRLVAVRDAKRNMRRESDAVERESRRLDRDLWGEERDTARDPPEEEGDHMEIMGAGPITINYGSQPPSPAAELPKAGGNSLLKVAAVGLALLGTSGMGASGAWALSQWLTPPAAEVVDTDTDTTYELGLGE